ncbi:MAG: uroporphyrinogen decarboxylase family protein [Planctomycetaceae bacterium]|nr:hypothetical protein [Planctomycetaceae bacterium]
MNRRDNLYRAITRNGPRWVPCGYEAAQWIGSPVVERPGHAGPDSFGCRWSLEPDAHGGTFPAHDGFPLKEGLNHWQDHLAIPDLHAIDWSGVASAAAAVDRKELLIVGCVEFGLFERSYLLLGMEEALVCYLTRPREMSDMLAAIADYKIELIRKLHSVAALDVLWFGDDWGTQRGLFIPPPAWRAVIKPHQKRIYDAIHDLGILIDQHSCGHIEAVFADMVEIGADMWNPCQPCNDLTALKRRFGRQISFHGGIDSQFVLSRSGVTPDQVRAEVRKRIADLAPGGGYLAAPSHCVPYDPALVAAMTEEIQSFGRAIYASPGDHS